MKIEELYPKKSESKKEKEIVKELEEKMIEIRIKELERKAKTLAILKNLPYVNLKGFPIDQEALILIPQEQAKVLKVIGLLKTDKDLRIGVVDPDNPEITPLKAELERETRLKVKIYLISQHSFEIAFKLYEGIPRVRKIIKGVGITEEELEKLKSKIKTFRDLALEIQNVSVTEIITLILAAALQSRASDIHVEAEERNIKIRFRIDGILHTAATLSSALWPKVISRIKLLSSLKINIEDRPQGGSFVIFLTTERIDVRVSTLPTSYGESVVMRILRSTRALEFEELGLKGKAYELLETGISRPNGLFVITGPTGSGKTTTLYAILKKLNKPEVKIATLEDPIEYRLEGINQSQIDPTKDYTFAAGLRTLMRQDPDIIMVGEIRDLETAEIVLNAALTGHLVFSTLHTNDAAGAIPRFLALSAKPFLLAPALRTVIAQRLVRKICQKCKEEIHLDKKTLTRAEGYLSSISDKSTYKFDFKDLKFYQGKGCEACQGLGYKGQVGIFEILSVIPEIEELILTGQASEYSVRKAALKAGMITMAQDGILKGLAGITSVEEVFRVIE